MRIIIILFVSLFFAQGCFSGEVKSPVIHYLDQGHGSFLGSADYNGRIIEIELSPVPRGDGRSYNLAFAPKSGALFSPDEASAVFVSAVSWLHTKFSADVAIKQLYLPSIFSNEWRLRLKTAAGKSTAWLNWAKLRTDTDSVKSTKIVSEIIGKEHVFREIESAGLRLGLVVQVSSVEEVLVNPEANSAFPETAMVWFDICVEHK